MMICRKTATTDIARDQGAKDRAAYEISYACSNAGYEKAQGRNREQTGEQRVLLWRGLKKAKS